MAGNYMDAPATRLSYDRDGSIGAFFTSAGVLDQLTAGELRTINSEAETGVVMASQSRVAIVFPAPMDVAAVFFSTSAASPTWSLETSVDTTTGIDGTWITHQTLVNSLKDVKPNYRIISQLLMTIPGTPSQNVRGVRLSASSAASSSIRALHIYADVSTLATTDRLAFWHPTLDEELEPNYFDWGNVPRGSSADKSFRIKNVSSDLTANDVTIYMEALTPGVPSVAGMHTISENGGATFLSSVTLTELLPGDLSSVLIVRRTVPLNAQVSVWSARIAADVANWTV